MFLMDDAGLPLTKVLEQLDLLRGEVVTAPGKELAVNCPVEVQDALTQDSFVAAARIAAVTSPEDSLAELVEVA
jgi:hypothetical protein